MTPSFGWITYDVSDKLPATWRQDVARVAAAADFRDFPRTPMLSREARSVNAYPRGRVHADQVSSCPGCFEFYRGPFLELAGE